MAQPNLPDYKLCALPGQVVQSITSLSTGLADAMKTMGTKYSPQMSAILDQTAQQLGGDPAAQQQASVMAQGQPSQQQPMSQSLKLPQNTNEGY